MWQILRIADIGIATQHILGSAGRLLTDEIATAGHTMLQGNTLDSDATILVDHLSLRGVYRMELDLEAQIVGVELYLMFEFWPQFSRSMHMEGCYAPHQPEGGNHTDESEAMVAMQVGDKDMSQFGKTHPALAQLHLGALGTVEHQNLLTHLDNLRRCVMPEGGKCTSTAKDMYLKRIHKALDFIKLVERLLEFKASEVNLWFGLPTVVLEGLLLVAQLADSLIGQ